MANGTASTPPPPPRFAKSKLLRAIIITILALIVIVGLVILISWLIIRPKPIDYSIEDGSVSNFNLQNSHLNASFDFIIRAHNPNSRISIYYDSLDVSLSYDDQTLAFNTLEPFHQPRRNVTRLEAKIEARDAALSQPLFKDMKLEKATGQIRVDLRIKARIRFKVGLMKFKHRHLSVICPQVMVHFSSSKIPQRNYCDIEY